MLKFNITELAIKRNFKGTFLLSLLETYNTITVLINEVEQYKWLLFSG